ncbi:hypothetical protein DYB30_001826 [Aphanomyces astaci]|uniref:Polycystin domain-containing protein n=1 Tax=Aphanomyces astaci TaxID=112090 RepID=A0A397CDG1_APHAT|nr:hypothetical protein DYB30_001826 [Aphanomyces astaci]
MMLGCQVNYVIFLALFLTVAITSTNGDDLFKFSKLVRSHLVVKNFQLVNTSVYKSYADVSNLDEFYEYLGTVRVAGQACDNLATLGSTWCLPEYSTSTASTDSFGLGHEPYEAVHTHIDEPSYISITNRVYPGPAFTVEIPNVEAAECNVVTKANCTVYTMLEELRHNKFWDLATRAIFVDFSVYNPHCKAVAVVRLFLEQTDGGGVMPSVSIRPFLPYVTPQTFQDMFAIVCESLLYLVVFHQAYVAVHGLRTVGFKYYAIRANIANDINIVFFFIVLGLKVLTHASLPTEFQDDVYVNLRSSANYDYLSRSVNSLNCFLSVLKVFKYLSCTSMCILCGLLCYAVVATLVIPTFSILTATVSGAVDELIGLFVMIAILLFGGSLAFTIHMLIACFANETQLFAKDMKLHTLGADVMDHILHRERQSHRSIREKPENMTNRVFPINDTQTSSVGPLDEAAVAAKIDHMLREMTDERTALSLDVERVLQHLEASKSTESEVHAQDLGVLLAYVHDLEEHLNSKLQAILQ